MQNLKSKYEQQETKVSDRLWEKLEQKLDQNPANVQKPKRVWLQYAAAIILMIGLGGSLLMINTGSEINDNQQFAKHARDQSLEQDVNQENKNSPELATENNSQTAGQNLLVDKGDSSAKSSIARDEMAKPAKEERPASRQYADHESVIKKEMPQVTAQPEEKLAQNDTSASLSTKPKVKYVSSSDLLFGVEIDKAKAEKPKSAMGINSSRSKNEPDILNPKRIKILGITLYDKDSITNK